MGTSGAYGGSGGAWGGAGQDAEDFADDPTDAGAEDLVDHTLQALQSEGGDEGDGGEEEDLPPEPFVPGPSTLPGLRVRPPGGTGGAGGGRAGGGGGGRTRTSGGGGGRSASRTAQAGGRAIAAGYALRAGDDAALRELGLSLAELAGLDVFEQMGRILDATVPASGSPQESEVRRATTNALIVLLKDGDDSPRAVVEAFVSAYVFEALITEHGERLRAGDPSGANAKEIERRLKSAIRAYTAKVDFPETVISADDFKAAIEQVLTQTEELVE